MNARRIHATWPAVAGVLGLLMVLFPAGPGIQPVGVAARGPVGNQEIYGDALVNGWQAYGWATINYNNTRPVHSGTRSISVRATAWQALFIHHAAFSAGLDTSLSLWLNGGPSGGQHVQLLGLLAGKALQPIPLAPLPANSWRHVTVSLASLGVADNPLFDGLWIADATGTTQPMFYVDDISLAAAPPATARVAVDAGRPVRAIDPRLFGINTAVWSEHLNTPDSVTMLDQMGNQVLRFPGGTLSDTYHWSTDKTIGNKQRWAADIGDFASVVEKTGSAAMVTVNYGSGTAQEAAALVAWANAAPTSTVPIGVDARGTNWRAAGYWATLRAARPLPKDDGFNFLRLHHPAPYHFPYWEIGNESYASWEQDDHTRAHDPYTYATVFGQYTNLMKRVDPSIKIGVVVADGEESYEEYFDHPATNPRTKVVHNGWTPVLLSSLKRIGVTPDFVAEHNYAQSPGYESDAALLRYAGTWPALIAALRAQLDDYLGPAGRRVEIFCTENNSVTNNPGKQTTSLVNGLYLADSLGYATQTELHALLWWDFRDDGMEKKNNNSTSLYGWRLYGGYQVLASAGDRYPTFYTRELLTHFAAGGDQVLRAASNNRLLDAFAARRKDGSVTLLLINKSPSDVLRAALTVSGFTAAGSATIYSYGMAQDNAAHTGLGSPEVAASALHLSGAALSVSVPPYTMDVVVVRAAK